MKNAYKAAVCILSGLVIVLGIGSGVQACRLQQAQNKLQATVESSMYNLVDSINTMECELSKVAIVNSRAKKQEIYRKVSDTASTALSYITALPVQAQEIEQTASMLNRINDYCRYLCQTENAKDEQENIQGLHLACKNLLSAISDISADAWYEDSLEQTRQYFAHTDSESLDYPTLIYDGPFSENEEKGKPKLRRATLTQEQCKKQAAICLDVAPEALTPQGELDGEIPCYIFGAAGGSTAVTKQGGLILWSFYADGQGNAVTQEQAAQAAVARLEALGYTDMEAVWGSKCNNEIIFNCTPKQNGIVLYPDLIKVHVSLSSGKILGIEGRSYIVNHTCRYTGTPAYSMLQAEGVVSDNLSIEKERLCVAPLYDSEWLCYEFTGTCNGVRYIVYIDAYTLAEINVLRVIPSPNGDVVM